jgi:hypothetical protein
MRWSEDGFNHPLHLRMAWVNQRFDCLFPHVVWVDHLPSPNLYIRPSLMHLPEKLCLARKLPRRGENMFSGKGCKLFRRS